MNIDERLELQLRKERILGRGPNLKRDNARRRISTTPGDKEHQNPYWDRKE